MSDIIDVEDENAYDEEVVVCPGGEVTFCYPSLTPRVSSYPSLTPREGTACRWKRCEFCGRTFKRDWLKKRHEETCSFNMGELKIIKCQRCSAVFNRKDALNNHIKRNCEVRANQLCLVENCGLKFSHKKTLIQHLKRNHASEGITVEDPVVLEFPSQAEFEKWKDDEEERTFSYFSKGGGRKKGVDYYYCQRDGKNSHKPKTSRRNIKGTVKTGMTCIATMTSTYENGKVKVVYHPTHSHICCPSDYVHQPLSKATNAFIEQQLAWGVPPSKVHKSLVSDEMQGELDPDYVPSKNAVALNLKRIQARARTLKNNQRLREHAEEARAVCLLAQQLEEEDTLLIFKPIGSGLFKGPDETYGLENNDELFLLGIQTPQQRQLMISHCSRIVVVGETDETNQHGYQLLTVLVVDESDRGSPVAHLITSHSDEVSLSLFFASIKDNLPEQCHINCAITLEDSAVFNAINRGFACNIRHLLCLRHVQKVWEEQLKEKGTPEELIESMNSELKAIAWERQGTTFWRLIHAFIKKYDSGQTKAFIDYFRKYYFERPNKWALCYRNFPHGNVETTEHLQSFHNNLKTNYLERKSTRRIDDLVMTLILFGMDDAEKRHQTTMDETESHSNVTERHAKGLKMADDSVTELHESLWSVNPSSASAEPYLVERLSTECPLEDHCFVVCTHPSCDSLCGHMYSCTCPDDKAMCPHIHKVHSMSIRGRKHSSGEPYAPEEFDIPMPASPTPTPSTSKPSKSELIANNLELMGGLREVMEEGECSETFLLSANRALKRLWTLHTASKLPPLGVKQMEIASNKNLNKRTAQISPSKKKKKRQKIEATIISKDDDVVEELLTYSYLLSEDEE